MKIEDIIEKFPEHYNLKIGANNGNGYFYCGTISDWVQNCDEYSEKLKEVALRRCNRSRNTCNNAIRNLLRDIKEYYELTGKSLPDDYIDSLDIYILNIAKMVNTKNNSKNRFNNYIPVKEREVINYFEADLAVEYPECLVILVKGTESGKFWDITEGGDNHVGINIAADNSSIGMMGLIDSIDI